MAQSKLGAFRLRAAKLAALCMIVSLMITACGSAVSENTAVPTTGTGGTSSAMDTLIAAAKAEGELTVIALPHNWLNYGEMIENFSKKIWHQNQRTQS